MLVLDSFTCIHSAEDIICTLIALENILSDNVRHTFLGNFVLKELQEICIVVIVSKTFIKKCWILQIQKRWCRRIISLDGDLIWLVVVPHILYFIGGRSQCPQREKVVNDVVLIQKSNIVLD